MTLKFNLNKFINHFKKGKTLTTLEYKNKYLDILFIFVQQGLLRGFYFEYLLCKKYIFVLFKYKINLRKFVSIQGMNKNFGLFLWTTNCGVLVNSNSEKKNLY